MTETEYAVRTEHGEIIPRQSLAFAQRTAEAIRSHGGPAVAVSRTVVRSDWAEVDDADEEREFDLGPAPDYKCFVEDHAACQEHRYVCTCGCHPAKEAP